MVDNMWEGMHLNLVWFFDYSLWRELLVSFAFHQAAIPTAVCHLDGRQCGFLDPNLPDVVRIVVNTPNVYKTSTNNVSINTTINVICWQIDLVG